MKFLIAGFGSAGRRHMRNLLQLGEKDIILYRTGRSTLPLKELEGFKTYTDLNLALGQKPDAVIIANVTSAHLDVAIPAANAGCHILLEKPVSHNLDQITDFENALITGGGKVLMGFQFRFHPNYLQVYDWLKEGKIGQPLTARAHYGDYMPGWHPWEDYRKTYSALPQLGGGAVTTLCHPVDYLRWFLGDVEAVTAVTGNIANMDIPVEDVAEIILHFNDNVLGSIHVDYFQQPPLYRFEIIGTEGTLQWDHQDNTARLYRVPTRLWTTISAPSSFERNHLFLDEMRHFFAVIRGEQTPISSLEDGIQVQKIVDAVYRSASNHKKVSL